MTYIIIQFRFPIIHFWPEAENYLQFQHRHEIYAVAKKRVHSSNREIEFIAFKEKLEAFCINAFSKEVIIYSCEEIASILLLEFNLDYCSIMEDGENGAEVQFESH